MVETGSRSLRLYNFTDLNVSESRIVQRLRVCNDIDFVRNSSNDVFNRVTEILLNTFVAWDFHAV